MFDLIAVEHLPLSINMINGGYSEVVRLNRIHANQVEGCELFVRVFQVVSRR